MKNLITVVLLQVALISCGQMAKKETVNESTTTKEIKSSHTVLFYNVENLFDTIDDPEIQDEDFLPTSSKQWTAERLQNKVEKIEEVILAVDEKGPLFIGLVEVENNLVIEQLLNNKGLKNINYNFAHFQSPDERGIDVALVYNSDYFTLQSKEALVVNLDDNDKTRDILYVKGLINDDSEPYHIFVNHWPSRGGGQEKSEPKRVLAAITLRLKIEQIQKEDVNAKIIVMGDFNDYPDNHSIKTFLKATNGDSLLSTELYNLAADLDENDKGSYNYKGDWGMLDQMMVSQSMLTKESNTFSVEKNGLTIFEEEFVLFYDKKYKESKPSRTYGGDNYYGGYSDHLPVYIKLERTN